jgi:hypothetical protein
MPAVIFFACLPSSPEGYAGHVIFNKNPHFERALANIQPFVDN